MKGKEFNHGKILIVLMIMMMGNIKMMAQRFEYPEYSDDNERIAVKYNGNRPTITDFTTAFLNYAKEKEIYGMVYSEWQRYLQKKPLSKNVSIIVDVKNGYMRYEFDRTEENDTIVMEMCFWNCADGKHRMVAANSVWMTDGDYGWDENIGTRFLLYDIAKKEMRNILAEDIGALYDGDGLSVFFLPRKGKNIRVSAAGGGDRWNELLEWDGYQFHSKIVP